MIAYSSRRGDIRRVNLRAAQAVISLPVRSERAFVLATDLAAALTTAVLVTVQSVRALDLVRSGILVAFALVYAECAGRAERRKRYLGTGKVFSNQISVWAFALVLVVPAGLASAAIAAIYLHSLGQRIRETPGHRRTRLTYRVVFVGATLMLAAIVARGVLQLAPRASGLDGQLVATAMTCLAAMVASAVNLALVLVSLRLRSDRPGIRRLLPDRDAVGYEMATFALGAVAAEFLIHSPLLTPLVLILNAYLHRGSMLTALHHASRTDRKTGLLNDEAWRANAGDALNRSRRDGRSVAILAIDVDRFKSINDTHGHLTGDKLLCAVAKTLVGEVREQEIIGRFGGDEFMIVLEGVDRVDAEQFGHRLQAAVDTIDIDGVRVAISLGLAHVAVASDGTDLEQLITRADEALYAAKAAGRGRLAVAPDPVADPSTD